MILADDLLGTLRDALRNGATEQELPVIQCGLGLLAGACWRRADELRAAAGDGDEDRERRRQANRYAAIAEALAGATISAGLSRERAKAPRHQGASTTQTA